MRKSENLDEDEVRRDFEKLFDEEESSTTDSESDQKVLIHFWIIFIATFVAGLCAIFYTSQFELFEIQLPLKAKPFYFLPTWSRIINQSK